MRMKKLIAILTLLPYFCISQWNQLGVDITGNMVGDEFGYSVALSGNGEIFATGSPSINNSTGQVKLFQWDGSNWNQKGSDLNGGNTGEQFGTSVALSDDGNTIIIGAPQYGIGGAFGFSVVYEWNGIDWAQKGMIIIGENTLLNGAGGAVSISNDGNIIAIGASGNSSGNGNFSGHTRVYVWNGVTWIQLGADIDGLNEFDSFGNAVSLNEDGTILAIGALGAGIGGEVTIYEWSGTSWTQLGSTISGGIANNFGSTVDLDASGTTISVGATSNDMDFGSGYVEVFSWNGNIWVQKGSRLESDPTGDDFFEMAKLSEDGNIIVIGGYGANAGFVEVHEFDGTDWGLIDTRINGEANGDFFGFAVDISNDGSIIVVGAPENGSNGLESGEVKVFENASILSNSDIGSFKSVSIFPNPTLDNVKIISHENIESYLLFSLNGKNIISESTINTKELNIDLSNLNSGVYILSIQSNNKSNKIKLVKK